MRNNNLFIVEFLLRKKQTAQANSLLNKASSLLKDIEDIKLLNEAEFDEFRATNEEIKKAIKYHMD